MKPTVGETIALSDEDVFASLQKQFDENPVVDQELSNQQQLGTYQNGNTALESFLGEEPQQSQGLPEEWDSEDSDDIDDELEWLALEEEDDSRITGKISSTTVRPNANGGALNQRGTLQPGTNKAQKLDSVIFGRVNHRPLDALDGLKVSNVVANNVKSSLDKQAQVHERYFDKSDRATVENALDPRTRMVLFKMLNRNVFTRIHGCVSTGKEANVYHALDSRDFDLAIKVYKTSILVFRDRDRYVAGDYRFRNGYCRSNPRKMVKMWAEKEMRNLMRLHQAGIPCPKPLVLKLHVLVMEFIGERGLAAPRLKDAVIPPEKYRGLYVKMVSIIRTLFQTCKLVHADLSEYNILYYQETLYIIDVSQAVDLDHPKALEFLREDSQHINDFFAKNGVRTLTVREVFDYAVDPTLTDEAAQEVLNTLIAKAEQRPASQSNEEIIRAGVFHGAFIARKLEEVVNYEKEQSKVQTQKDGPFFATITGMKSDLTGPRTQSELVQQSPEQQDSSESDASEDSDHEDDQEESGTEERRRRKEPVDKDAIREARKANKKEVKEFNKERRKTKKEKTLKNRRKQTLKQLSKVPKV
eukprot:TRINITY_DN2796_c0_g2_i1.p1 TRINITY_DN2796_c0_g2~~TRINITY_DN2796_c0_g2_i1.p1  ORF type:complete len:585 (-),score=77.22 TRINITY_DN2796_c0_g2_i1:572-2326(-)